MEDKAAVLICGGGIIGLTIARELLKKGFKNMAVLEKENEVGKHASGRNSGVLHAGIYYTQDSLKAKFCLKGNFLMKDYCREKNIPVLETGKVIVANNQKEIPVLEELYKRALINGAKAEMIDEDKLKTIEPFAKTCGHALYSPYTAVTCPKKILANLENDLISSGEVRMLKGFAFRGVKGNHEIKTNKGNIKFDLFINAAGSFSDMVAHQFGVGLTYKVLPFKGTYKKLSRNKCHLVKGSIYPVPDIANPFLGVHLTRLIDGTVSIGPTAIPAFGRENYGLIDGLDSELFEILYRDAVLFLTNPKFRKVALEEPQKCGINSIFRDIKDMVEGVTPEDIEPSIKTGIRPQLVDWGKKELVMDYIVLKYENTVHVLNTISPGFTSSMAFAEFVVERYVS